MESHRALLTAGSNAKGQLGIDSYDDAYAFTPCRFAECGPNFFQLSDLTSTVAQIACGANHTVLLLEHGDGSTTLWGTGDGRRGQLGPKYFRRDSARQDSEVLALCPWTIFHNLNLLDALPPPLNVDTRAGYAYKLVAAAWETTYVVLSRPGSSDVLLSMGSNDFGALGAEEGLADQTRSGLAETGPGELRVVDFGHDLLPDDVRSQSRRICVQSLHAGPRHIIAQLVITITGSDGLPPYSQTVLVGWGASRHGQLGQNSNGGTLQFLVRPTLLPINIHADPMVSCGLGNQHTVVLHESGRISALGSNKQGQIPSLEPQRRVSRLGCTWNGTYTQTVDGDRHSLLSTGNNAQGQLGRSHTAKSASADGTAVDLPRDCVISGFVCGSEHVLVVLSRSLKGESVLGWGWNEHGNMGLGSLGNITVPTRLWPREDVETYNKYPQRVIGMWAGCATSWLLVE